MTRPRRSGAPCKPTTSLKRKKLPVWFSDRDLEMLRTSATARGYRISDWVRGRLGLGWPAVRHASDAMGLDLRNPKEDPWPGDLWRRVDHTAEFGRIIQVRGVTYKKPLRVAIVSVELGDPLIDLTRAHWIATTRGYEIIWIALARG